MKVVLFLIISILYPKKNQATACKERWSSTPPIYETKITKNNSIKEKNLRNGNYHTLNRQDTLYMQVLPGAPLKGEKIFKGTAVIPTGNLKEQDQFHLAVKNKKNTFFEVSIHGLQSPLFINPKKNNTLFDQKYISINDKGLLRASDLRYSKSKKVLYIHSDTLFFRSDNGAPIKGARPQGFIPIMKEKKFKVKICDTDGVQKRFYYLENADTHEISLADFSCLSGRIDTLTTSDYQNFQNIKNELQNPLMSLEFGPFELLGLPLFYTHSGKLIGPPSYDDNGQRIPGNDYIHHLGTDLPFEDSFAKSSAICLFMKIAKKWKNECMNQFQHLPKGKLKKEAIADLCSKSQACSEEKMARQCTISVGDLAAANPSSYRGVDLLGHREHRLGECFDIRPIRNDDQIGVAPVGDPNNSTALNSFFTKFLKSFGAEDIFYNGPGPFSQKISGHHHHIHFCLRKNKKTKKKGCQF